MKNIDKSKYYTKFELEIKDPVVEKVIKKFAERSEMGMKKYSRSLQEERISGMKSLADYLKDVQEELMNAVIYIQTAKDELKHLALAEQEKAEFLMRRDSYEQGL
tara:strand:+ start:237 stop:551 length:315 start_codon:yes stop_codon:yes gene_type:complete